LSVDLDRLKITRLVVQTSPRKTRANRVKYIYADAWSAPAFIKTNNDVVDATFKHYKAKAFFIPDYTYRQMEAISAAPPEKPVHLVTRDRRMQITLSSTSKTIRTRVLPSTLLDG
jgi:hypothetical protein